MNDNTRTASPDGDLSPLVGDGATLVTAGGTAVDTAAAPANPPGFDLLGVIGTGGMGEVYRARDRVFDREVAVKLLLPRYAPGSHTAARFLDEARITAQLQHPGIPAVYQVGRLDDGRPFLAMKLIKGRTLHALMEDNSPLDPLAVFGAISQAVGYAHAHGVIHRDLKPANIMVGAFGEVQVMDWGLAKVLGDRPEAAAAGMSPEHSAIQSTRDSGGSFTQAGSVLGTPAFMPPEQAAGEVNRIGTASDVFGLGAILCVLLTGKPPFDGTEAESVRLNAVRGRTEAAFARLDACGAAPDVVALCKRCLAFEPADRPATADEVANAVADLRRAADDRAKLAERATLAADVRRRSALWATAAVAAVLLLGAAGTTINLVRANAARADAETARHAAEQKRAEAEAAHLAEAAAAKQADDARKAEAAQRQRAEAARTWAEARAAETAAVLSFVQRDILAAVRPKGQAGGLGRDVTLRDAVQASLDRLSEAFAGQPLVEARVRTTLGSTFHYLGDRVLAAEQRRIVGAIYEKLPPDDPRRLYGEASLALAEHGLGRTAEAIRIGEGVLPRQRKVLGPDDDSTLATATNLGNSYTAAGRHRDALALRQEVLDHYRAKYPPTHEKTLLAMFNLSRSLYALRRHAEALGLREQVLAARRQALPPNHPDTLIVMNRLAKSYDAVGRRTEAVAMWEDALAGQSAVLGPDHPDTLETRYDLAGTLVAAGRHEDALATYRDVLRGRTARHGPGHSETQWAALRVAECLVELNRAAEAIPVVDAALQNRTPATVASRLCDLRLRHFLKERDAAACRATAELWEKHRGTTAGDMYDVACYRAVAARLYARAAQPDEAAADAERAMGWLTKAVAAGWRDRAYTEKDADLAFLRGRPDYQALVGSLEYTIPPPRPAR